MLSAGSMFTPRLVNDVLRTPGVRGGEISLVDIDPKRLLIMKRLIEKLLAKLKAKDWKVVAIPDHRKAMRGSDYIVNSERFHLQMAALCASNMGMFDLGATAAIERIKEVAIHALMLDPLTSAIRCPSEIKKMTLEMFSAENAFLPGYR